MIHHISIPANDPSHVSAVLAELMAGRTYPFPGGIIPDSFMAVSGDPHGTMIEVYPADMTLEPEGVPIRKAEQTAQRGPFHILLSVPLDREAIEAIGAREGWTTRFCARGLPGEKPFFNVIELWVEDHFLIEVAAPDMVADYTNLVQIAVIDQMMAAAA